MVVFPNIKINLGLNVLGKRPDGYHNLQSIFYPVQWCDVLEILPAETFVFKASGLEISGKPEKNLVVKAYQLIKQDFNLPPVAIYLHKAIPTGAGLGAGSSDASFTLMALNKLFELNLTENQLLTYAEKLGSDCPFFILNTPCLVTGRGEILEKVALSLGKFWIKVVYTGLQISTKEAFEGFQPDSTVSNLKPSIHSDFADFKNRFKNDFEPRIVDKHPALAAVREHLLSEGAFYVSMSGSGSAFYGLFEKEPSKTNLAKFEFITHL